jgi:hypothetical protein
MINKIKHKLFTFNMQVIRGAGANTGRYAWDLKFFVKKILHKNIIYVIN